MPLRGQIKDIQGNVLKSATKKILVLIAVLVLIGAIMFRGHQKYNDFLAEFDYSKVKNTGKPVLLQLGFRSCPPCKMMKPILKDLKKSHSSEFDVAYIDINYQTEAVTKYGTRTFPTLIFLDEENNELYRYVGYMPKEDILRRWKELGVIGN